MISLVRESDDPYLCKTDLAEGLECPKCHGSISENDTRCPHCGVRFG